MAGADNMVSANWIALDETLQLLAAILARPSFDPSAEVRAALDGVLRAEQAAALFALAKALGDGKSMHVGM